MRVAGVSVTGARSLWGVRSAIYHARDNNCIVQEQHRLGQPTLLGLDGKDGDVSARGFDRRKFEELVLYIAERTADDPAFGRTKLAKALFYADFEAFRLYGESITGAPYQAWQYGPYPPALESAINRLKNERRIDVLPAPEEFDPDRIVPRPGGLPAESERFTDRLALIDEWIGQVQQETASSIERHVHEHFAWKLFRAEGLEHGRVNEEIPYAAAFLPSGPPTKDQVHRALERARKHGVLTDEGFIWERGSS
jgi:hypothetical protein